MRWDDTARRAASDARSAVQPARLLHVAKTALAVGIAWAVAPLMPGVTDEYPYYAPLGALVSMYPTLMGSVKSSLQTLLGLGAGIGLALLVTFTIGPTWWSVPLAVGIGLLLSGTNWFGAGRDYVPMAVLFVLIVGGGDAEDYSLGYLAQMGVGVAVGLIVNLVIVPPLWTPAARARIRDLQDRLAQQLHDIGEAVAQPWPPERAAWSENTDALVQSAGEVREALAQADESRRGNPRAWRDHARLDIAHTRLDTLDRIAHQVRELSGALADTIWERPGSLRFDSTLAQPISDACRAVAEALSVHGDDDPAEHRALGAAAGEVRHLIEAVEARSLQMQSTLGPGALTTMHLRRIVTLLRDAGRNPWDEA